MKLESSESGGLNDPKVAGNIYKLLKETNEISSYADKEYEQDITYKEVFQSSLYLGSYTYGNSKEIIKYLRDYLVLGEKRYVLKHNFYHIASLCKILPGSSPCQILVTLSTIKTKSISGGIIGFIGYIIPSLSCILLISFLMKNIKTSYSNISHMTIDGYQVFNKEEHYNLYVLEILFTGIAQGCIGLLIQDGIKVLYQEATSKFQTLLIIFSALIYYCFLCNVYIPFELMIICGIASLVKMDSNYALDHSEFSMQIEGINFIGLPCLILCVSLYLILFFLNYFFGNRGDYFDIMESFYRIGGLLYTGGQMIAPLLLTEHCNDNLIEEAEILHGFACASLLPGPIVNTSGFIGTLINDVLGGILATISIFMPGMLLALGSIKYFDAIKENLKFQYFLKGVSSSGIGMFLVSLFKFWYDSCLVNPYSNLNLGTINIIACYIMLDKLGIPIPFVLIFGAMFSFYSFLLITNFN